MDKGRHILKVQKIRSYLIIGICCVIIWGIGHLMFQDISSSYPPRKPAMGDLPVDKVNAQDIWMNRQNRVLDRLETESKLSDQMMKMLEELMLSHVHKEMEIEKEKSELKKTIVALQITYTRFCNG